MKRLVLLTALLALVVGMATVSHAATIKASGQWAVEFLFSDNFDLNKAGGSGDSDFDVYQRARTQFEFIANENLKGVLQTEVGTERWGNGAFEFGASAVGIEVRRAYLQFTVPGTKITTSAGHQPITLPNSGAAAFGGSNIILDNEMASIATSVPVTDFLGVTVGYGRLIDDDTNSSAGNGSFDAAFMALPVKLSGVEFTPYFLYGYAGTKSVYDIVNGGGPNGNLRSSMLAGLTTSNPTVSPRQAWWGGTSFTMKAFDPINVFADVAYGRAGSGKDQDDRSGWMFDLAVNYTGFDFMTPEVFFVYTTGEDGNNSKNSGKSERMPLLNTEYWAPGSFFFGNDTLLAGSKGFDNRQLGFWALGASLRDITFIEKLKHTVTVMYVQGTNDKHFIDTASSNVAAYNLTLTEKDHIWEVDLNNSYQIYDQLMMTLDLGWINNGYSKSVWGNTIDKADAYKLSTGLAYSF